VADFEARPRRVEQRRRIAARRRVDAKKRKKRGERVEYPEQFERRYGRALAGRSNRFTDDTKKKLKAWLKANRKRLDERRGAVIALNRRDGIEPDEAELDGLNLDAAELDPVVLRKQIARDVAALKKLIGTARRRALRVYEPDAKMIRRIGSQLSLFTSKQIFRLVQKVAQINPFAGLPASVVGGWTKRSVDLIVTVDKRFFSRIETAVIDGVRKGSRAKTLAKIIDGRVDGTPGQSHKYDGWRIARDQIGKLHADVTEARFVDAGVKEWIWRTSRDNRVREEHEELEGEKYRTGSGGDPEEGRPGDAIGCRCTSEPVLDF